MIVMKKFIVAAIVGAVLFGLSVAPQIVEAGARWCPRC